MSSAAHRIAGFLQLARLEEIDETVLRAARLGKEERFQIVLLSVGTYDSMSTNMLAP